MTLHKKILPLMMGIGLTHTAWAAQPVAVQVQNTPAATKNQQVEIEALKAQLDNIREQLHKTQQATQDNAQKLEATAEAIDAKPQAKTATHLGGYGELHVNRWQNQLPTTDPKTPAKDKNEIDFHRFVLFVGHEFNSSLRFKGEFELEHALAGDSKAGESKPGEVELEQAYVEWDFLDKHRARAGIFLVPVGIMNETHEPETFYGVERNPVENHILPTTWWEGGTAISGELAEGLSYDAALHSGLKLDEGKAKIREGRKKVASAPADTFAYTGRIKYTGIAGLELASSLQYQQDLHQKDRQYKPTAMPEVDAILLEAHAVYQSGPFSLRALYATWHLDTAINTTSSGANEQTGWYIEPAYRVNDTFGVFVRYSDWDNQAGDSANSVYSETSVGGNYWLAERAVLKWDVFTQKAPTGKDYYQGFNLGMGYSF